VCFLLLIIHTAAYPHSLDTCSTYEQPFRLVGHLHCECNSSGSRRDGRRAYLFLTERCLLFARADWHPPGSRRTRKSTLAPSSRLASMLKIHVSKGLDSHGNMMERCDLLPRISSLKAEVGTHKVQGPVNGATTTSKSTSRSSNAPMFHHHPACAGRQTHPIDPSRVHSNAVPVQGRFGDSRQWRQRPAPQEEAASVRHTQDAPEIKKRMFSMQEETNQGRHRLHFFRGQRSRS